MRARFGMWAAALALLLAGNATNLAAQYGQDQKPQDKPTLKDKPQQPGTPAPAAPAVNAEEDAALKAYQDAPVTDAAKKTQLGEEFLQKYPQSRYREYFYSTLTVVYFSTGQVKKVEEAGMKAVALNPNDVQVLGILATTLPRALSQDPTEAAKQLEHAEQYAQRAIDVVPTLPKPANATDESFLSAKNAVLAMAHGGLGLAYVRRQKYPEAIRELDQAVQLDPQTNPDPVNYYLLGLANEKASHFDDAVTAFGKCAAIAGQMQAVCKTGAEEAKKLAATQLSAPK